jgi:transposase InsO family protein
MNVHKNARLTPKGREQMVQAVLRQAETRAAVAAAFAVSVRTVSKWVRRFQSEGLAGLTDRSSRPHHLARATAQAKTYRIERLRRKRLTYIQIAQRVGVSSATVCRLARAAGFNRLSAVEPAGTIQRYERACPGEIIHIDIKRLARIVRPGHRITGNPRHRTKGAGYECLYVAVDDHSRVAFGQILPDQQAGSAGHFLRQVVAYYTRLGVKVLRVMTDNGAAFVSRAFARACRELKLKHLRIRPYTPRTNGKAERFIQTALREWAYAKRYPSSSVRTEQLPRWLHYYNWHRLHYSLHGKPPFSRLALSTNNLLQLHN